MSPFDADVLVGQGGQHPVGSDAQIEAGVGPLPRSRIVGRFHGEEQCVDAELAVVAERLGAAPSSQPTQDRFKLVAAWGELICRGAGGEVGSDMAGSIRLPAALNGVYGLKTTEHRVPTSGFFLPLDAGPNSVRVVNSLGPIARNLDDLELTLAIIAGPDGQSINIPAVPVDPHSAIDLSGLRIAVAQQLPGTVVARELRDQVGRFADTASDAGAIVTTDLPEFDWSAMYHQFGLLVSTIVGVFNPFADLTGDLRTLACYLTALSNRDRMYASWVSFFGDVDVLVCPAAADVAFAHQASGAPITIDAEPVDYHSFAAPHMLANMTGLPALVAPNGCSGAGLPTAIQLVGPAWNDTKHVAIARALEYAGVLPGYRQPPLPTRRP